jgi:hypothetical protein
MHRINISAPGPRPPYYRVAEHLWGIGCNINSDGNSERPDDTNWTELTIELRGVADQRVDVDPVADEPLILQVRSTSLKLARDAATFIVDSSGGEIQEVP